MALMTTQVISVREMSQAGQVRRAASELAEEIGFDDEATGRVSLVATEAATNLAKHARDGEIVIAAAPQPDRGVDITALDHGPGIQDVDRALRDGYSTASGGMGSGLGAIRRMASQFDLYTAESGTILFARVGKGPPPERREPDVEVGAIQVPYPGERVSGDAWAVASSPGITRVLIVDGLGHGVEAHDAATVAVQVFGRHAGDSPGAMLERLHVALRATRGAAAAVLHLEQKERIVRFAGIGNISGTVLGGGVERSMVSHHGVLGHSARKIQEFAYPWPPRALVVAHSDGIGTHWALDRYPGLERRRPALVAAVLYRDFNRGRDDATVVALREVA